VATSRRVSLGSGANTSTRRLRDDTKLLQPVRNRYRDMLRLRGCMMAELIDFESEPGTSTTLRDQRRPGRREFADPSLIPILRGQAPLVPESLPETVEAGDLAVEPDRKITLSAARGICLGVALGSLIWGSIGAGFWYYFQG
jgi:hypothetical protein